MSLEIGGKYRVCVQGRGKGTVGVLRQRDDGMVDSLVESGKYLNRLRDSEAVKSPELLRDRTKGDHLCFYADDPEVECELVGK